MQRGKGCSETGKGYMPSWIRAAAAGISRGDTLGLVDANMSGKRKKGSSHEAHKRKAGKAEIQLSHCETRVTGDIEDC